MFQLQVSLMAQNQQQQKLPQITIASEVKTMFDWEDIDLEIIVKPSTPIYIALADCRDPNKAITGSVADFSLDRLCAFINGETTFLHIRAPAVELRRTIFDCHWSMREGEGKKSIVKSELGFRAMLCRFKSAGAQGRENNTIRMIVRG